MVVITNINDYVILFILAYVLSVRAEKYKINKDYGRIQMIPATKSLKSNVYTSKILLIFAIIYFDYIFDTTGLQYLIFMHVLHMIAEPWL